MKGRAFLVNMLKQEIFDPTRINTTKVLSNPSDYGLSNAKNYRIPTEGGSMGAWHIWPEESGKTTLDQLGRKDVLIVYMHGQYDTRGYEKRLNTYRRLHKMKFHVLTFDYRGYGDSSDVDLSEDTVVTDGIHVLKWLSTHLKNNRNCSTELPKVLIWGHSLGSGISALSLYKWENFIEKDLTVCGLVLEAPFNNMFQQVLRTIAPYGASLPLNILTRFIIRKANTEFRTDAHLPQIFAPTLILHAEDDERIPAKLGQKLYDSALMGGKRNIKLNLYPAELSYGHSGLYQVPELRREIRLLWQSAAKQLKETT